MRDLLRTVRVNTSSVDYAVQTTRTNAAAPVGEGLAKPYSDFAWSSATVVVRVLAHLAKITRQAMDDAPRLMDEIDSEMRYGLGYVEERQFLYGSGVGQNLHGIIPQATAFAATAGVTVTNKTKIDVLRLAMLQGAVALLPPTGIVLNDVDWADIELTKTTDGAYLFANPQGTVQPRMWGLPVVNTPAMDVGDFLVGNFQLGATVYDRMDVEVLISTENVDDFEKNLATVRAEERVAIAVKRPEAFVTGDFTTALALL
jgi:HK97 family phage major capsid protein